ncbi:uncharacterized protein SCHCODRAFT_02516099 [Schizophyllum commune H4-8]|nr:uncharacterized protein SCHCODRAFT_02516099 [Schizophyllum commune H4-8]KAI5886799.1 hypothetical protein SCHCODRAFT_02516099 [Schizophyllum commune H4-8]
MPKGVRSVGQWRCSYEGCPDPDYPRELSASATNRATSHRKSTLHGYKYHHKQVTVHYKGQRITVKRDQHGLFQCPCGDPAHARRRSDRLVYVCNLKNHPPPGVVGGRADTPTPEDNDTIVIQRRPPSRSNGASSNAAVATTSTSRRACRRSKSRTLVTTGVGGSRKRASEATEEVSDGETSDEELMVLRSTYAQVRELSYYTPSPHHATQLKEAEKRRLRRRIARITS